ncbi:AAA family ATPase [Yoonia algicola]|uniref:ATP-binding protein n=1 Tax=Yoonia algicola TaxID=3137368 RepID=A0AAN0M529_9RHOB
MTDYDTQLIHLICGSTGAGKTTYARELATNIGGAVFSIDEWMVTLFGEDAPAHLDPTWIFPRVHRCETQIWAIASQLGMLRVPAILDLGFQRREHRQRFSGLAKQAELTAKLHVLNVDASERWRRVNFRNKDQGETFHMEITRSMFDYIENAWEPPSDDEIEAVARTDFG